MKLKSDSLNKQLQENLQRFNELPAWLKSNASVGAHLVSSSASVSQTSVNASGSTIQVRKGSTK